MAKVIEFLKKYWKWILFPVGLIGLLVAAAASRRQSSIAVDVGHLEDIDAEKDESLVEAARERDEKLQELAETHKERLQNLSEEQEKELQELADKPLKEVVDWFDKL